MNAFDTVHLALHALGKEVRGRTKLQKLIYFLGVVTNSLDDLGYRAHFYGPYSADVASAVDSLRALGFVEQQVASAGAVDHAGFEVARYDYKLTEQGQRMANVKSTKNPADWRKINDVVGKLKKADELDYVKLSIAAKTYYMLGEKKGTAQIDELVGMATKFGWNVTADEIKQSVQFLESLKLVKLN